MRRHRSLTFVLVAFATGSLPARAETPGASLPSGGDLWIAPATVESDELWFPDEIAPLVDALAELLARPELGGYHVLSPKQVRAFYADVRAGRLPGVPVACAAPPPPSSLARIVYHRASSATVSVDCPPPLSAGRRTADPGCLLSVQVASPRPTAGNPGNFEETARFTAHLPRGEQPSRWAERLRRGGLERARDVGGIGSLGIGIIGTPPQHDATTRPPFRVELDGLRVAGGWPSPLTAASFSAVAPALDACSKPRPMGSGRFELPYYHVEVDAKGAVRRCDVESSDPFPEPELTCACGVLGGMRFEPAAAPRRAGFSLTVSRVPDRGDRVEGSVRLERRAYLPIDHATDPTAALTVEDALDQVALVACLSTVRAPIRYPLVPVRLAIGADGRVTGHDVKWPAKIPPAVAQCLEGVIAQGQFNCPLSGRAAIDGRLNVEITRRRLH
jgi:hypothetical protein